MFPVSVPRTFKIAEGASVMELLFTKVTGDIFTLCNSIGNCNACIVNVRKCSSSRSFEKSQALQACMSTVCNASTKNS